MNKIPRCFDCFGYRYNHCVVLAEEYSNSNECLDTWVNLYSHKPIHFQPIKE